MPSPAKIGGSVAYREAGVEVARPADTNDEDKVNTEYLGAVFEKGNYYSVDVPSSNIGEDGGREESEEPVFSCRGHCS